MPRLPAAEPMLSSLRRCRLFDDIGKASLESLGRSARRHRYARGEVIFHQGDPGDTLHVLAAGAVKISLRSLDGDEAIVAMLGPGDFFGELALLDEGSRSASAEALVATETLALPRASFHTLLDERTLRDLILARVVAEVRRTDRQLEGLRFLDLGGRLAAHLAELTRQIGRPVPGGGFEVTLPYRQADLAAIVGGSRQSVSRVLHDLADQGLLELNRNRIIIRDLEQLARLGEP